MPLHLFYGLENMLGIRDGNQITSHDVSYRESRNLNRLCEDCHYNVPLRHDTNWNGTSLATFNYDNVAHVTRTQSIGQLREPAYLESR
jgi:hypothetical protein